MPFAYLSYTDSENKLFLQKWNSVAYPTWRFKTKFIGNQKLPFCSRRCVTLQLHSFESSCSIQGLHTWIWIVYPFILADGLKLHWPLNCYLQMFCRVWVQTFTGRLRDFPNILACLLQAIVILKGDLLLLSHVMCCLKEVLSKHHSGFGCSHIFPAF